MAPLVPFTRLDLPNAAGTVVAYTRPQPEDSHIRIQQEVSASKTGVYVTAVALESEDELREFIGTVARAFTQHQTLTVRPEPLSEPVCLASTVVLFKRLFGELLGRPRPGRRPAGWGS